MTWVWGASGFPLWAVCGVQDKIMAAAECDSWSKAFLRQSTVIYRVDRPGCADPLHPKKGNLLPKIVYRIYVFSD
jgi:hypothetical protein